ncbi:MAG: LytTR family DNA-binding domain-containing protein [candidate division KSB1 bacterium]|nr:LytTR family DNA-binding domain-containing protein [candidate division KSB1 bacterium]MDZ7334936.1 LytTR family DNA-binding domain-containing protein [candidate division KSB1 bacterium]MDZ7358379.1 LytTR family DNA-binding domain-containing protein [candidate division KSB1 bacterium]MDZ7376390.1 LytTR family DNA-binding domain-containing protein [candidate division KSB1 bacterium]MDZ7401708.1 LytTR family DNA-binding domain-containing protein [candidate division KSB1 bacterium]
MNKPVTAIIVDDEWLVREELKALLTPYPELTVIGEAANVPQAIELIHQEAPDVIFLDIQMPGASGFDLLEQTDINAKIIFVTAYDQYALKAFEVNALDYLLKPIQKDRLAKTIQRVLASDSYSTTQSSKLNYDDVLYVLVSGSLKFIKLPLLRCIVAEGNYSYIYYKGRSRELVSKTLQQWEQILPEEYFVRIHRSTIVNFEYVEQVKKCRNYTHLVYVRDIEKPFVMSRRYAARLKKTMTW